MTEHTDTELRELARDLATGPLTEEHCHASITDKVGELDACGREAESWVIYDPETGDDRAWPVCSLHMSEVYYGQRANRWVAAVNALPGLLDRVKELDKLYEECAGECAEFSERMIENYDRAERAEAEVERLRGMARRSRQMSRVWEAEEETERLRAGIADLADTGERDGRGNSLALARRLRSLLDQAGGA